MSPHKGSPLTMANKQFNIPFETTSRVMDALGIDYAQALCLVNLHAYLSFRSMSGITVCSQGEIVRNSRMSKATVKRHFVAMEKLGWLEQVTQGSVWRSSHYKITGFPQGSMVNPQGVHGGPVHDEPPGGRDESCGGSMVDELGVMVSPHKEITKKERKELTTNNSQSTGAKKKEDKSERIKAIWNEHKPNSWQSIQVMGNRIKVVDALAKKVGGFEKFCELLPVALKQAGNDKWWGKKQITWANFMGQGSTNKAHFESMIDAAATSSAGWGSKQNNPGRLEHPEFFPPTDSGRMIAKPYVKFDSIDDKKAREATAREFYATQSQAK